MKQVVLTLDLHDDRDKRRALKRVTATTSGIDSISVDMKEKKLTVTGDFDPVKVVSKLRKFYRTDVVSVGEPKKPEDNKKKGAAGEDGGKDKKDPEPMVAVPYCGCYPHHNSYNSYGRYGQVVAGDDPNNIVCVIS